MEALSDDLMSDGDIWNALQRITRWGLQRENEPAAPGLQSLLQRLRSQRQKELERYNLDSLMDDVRDQVAEIVQTEQTGIDRKVREAGDAGDEALREMLETIAQRKRELLDGLSGEPGAAISALANYEFLDEGARAQFEALEAMLEQQVLQSRFRNMQESLQSLGGSELGDLKAMLRDLNAVLRDHLDGQDTDFDRFMEQHGRYFPGAGSFDEIAAQLHEQSQQMESLLRSMSPEMRRSLDDLMKSLLRDEALQDELATMVEILESMAQFRRPPPDYDFSGHESITLEEALRLMRRLHDLDLLEREMRRAQETGDLETIDPARVSDLMGDDAGQAVDRLRQLSQVLEEAGYIQGDGGALTLTARGTRIIGQKALQDIFRHLKQEAFGGHEVSVQGLGGDRTDDVKTYEFGDNFLLDMSRTVMNSVRRSGGGRPVRVEVEDFEVFRTEQLTQASTVLMLDMSRSMPLRGCFVAAKKVALALNSLIRTQFPRDNLYIIGFSDFARQLRPESLHQITWGDYVYGTNMQHGFVMARRLLGRHQSGTRQIILITDGEPTAHFEGDRVEFAYPPTFRTFQETLREVSRCTREGIVINTFMLERSHYLTDFVNQMTRINRGRAFFATPERLGDYVLVDYVASKRKRIN
jgi:uncharacterized protein with von Willebrand factor type A (vWA) domain